MTPNIYILQTINDVTSFFREYAFKHESEYIVIDVETDSLNERSANLYGIGICFDETEAFYIPIRNKSGEVLWDNNTLNKITGSLYKIISTRKLLGHNIIYDVLVLKNSLGIDLIEKIYADTILMKHCIEEEPPFGLKETAVKYLGEWADKAQKVLYDNIKANGGRTTKDCMEMFKADTQILGEYCAWDVILTYMLFQKFFPLLKEQELDSLFFIEEIMPLYKECVIPMKDKGFPIDVGYFKNLKKEIEQEILLLEDSIQSEVEMLTEEYVTEVLEETFPVKPGGSFAKELAIKLGMPHTKTLLKKYEPYQPIDEEQEAFASWILTGKYYPEILDKYIYSVQTKLWFSKNPEDKYVFNINSTKQLSWLIFDKLGIRPVKRTEKGAPKLDAETLDELAGQHPFCDRLIEYRKLQKLLGTYIEGLLDRQYQDVIYGSFLMFGTTSGRFSSRDPNLQNLPRIKDDDAKLSPLVLKYTNAIKKGFIAGKGYKIVNADQSQLEPRAFAVACGDDLLQQAFRDKEDLYGSIAKNIWKLECTANEVKKKYPELRQKAKVVALAVVYGAEAGRISQVLECPREEAQKIINDYLNAYPGLKHYMKSCDAQAISKGFVKNQFGRIRHLPEAKILGDKYGTKLLDYKWANRENLADVRRKFKNYLNNSKNFPIQSTAAHVVNRAMIATSRAFKQHNIEGYIVAQVHDEVTCIVREDQADLAASLLKEAMENTTKIAVPLVAEPVIGNNWAEAK